MAQRRGAAAAAVLLVLLLDARLDAFIVGWDHTNTLEAWLYLVFTIVEVGLPMLVLPLLGPGAMRAVVGGRPTPVAMVSGFLCGLTGVALFWSYAVLLFMPLRAEDPPAAGPLFVTVLCTVVFCPFAEEWAIRGVLWSALRRLCRPSVAVVITAVVFALLHGPDRLHDFPCLFAFGVVMGILRARSGSLAPSILAHSVTNVGLVVFMT